MPFFDGVRRRLAQHLVDHFGFLDVYFRECAAQPLDLIGQLRYCEMDYRDSLITFMSETLSLPEMIIILIFGQQKSTPEPDEIFPNLTGQARKLAQFYIETVKSRAHRIDLASGAYTQRYLSRWRRPQT